MRKELYILGVSLLPLLANAQQDYTLRLQSGNYTPQVVGFAGFKADPATTVNGHYYRYIQFFELPTEDQKRALSAGGVVLYDYMPGNVYLASVKTDASIASVVVKNIRSVFVLPTQYKLSKDLANKKYPSWALKPGGKIELMLAYQPDLNVEQVAGWLRAKNVEVTHTLSDAQSVRVIAPIAALNDLAAQPYVAFIEPFDANPKAENLVGRTDHRSNMIATDYASGLHFDGTGVSVALNDDGVIGPHIDYQGRLAAQYITFNNGNHGDHCAGIIFGAGNRNPTTRGMAHGATLRAYGVSGVYPSGYQAFDSITNHYANLGVRITSTSYSDGNNAGYTTRARNMDMQILAMPQLMHVFSSGNAGTSDFGYGAGAGWGNITGGHKMGKNVITVGNLTYQDALASSSSRGPAHDGRIKPDICAVGTDVNSTVNPNTYELKTGTSMACPGVSGTLAQLYHAYKTANAGANPPSALIKAVVMNTGDDLGNPGPDYRFGWGRINARRAWALLAANQYLLDSITTGVTKTHTINVPANTAELRVMIYWADYQAAVGATKALVNNINMKLITPSATQVFPWILNPAPNATTLNQNATQGIDTLNNMEQVTIASPAAGSYTVNVNGFAIPQGPQKYYVVYEFVNNNLVLTYPSGGESIVPATQETIRWDAYGSTGTFTLEYSTNNGSSWTTIATNIAATQRYYNWTPPNVVTGQALVRVTRGTTTDVSDAPFSIIGVPANLTVNWVCVDSMKVSYSAVTGATSYVVTILGNTYMDSVGTSTTTSCVIHGINTSAAGWVSVEARGPNSCKGRRQLALNYLPAPYNCNLSDDIGVLSYNSPTSQTVFECSGNAQTENVSITVKNNGSNPVSNITFKYTIDGGTPVVENYAGPIASGFSYLHSFATPAVFSATGIHTIKAWVEHPNDQTHGNDTVAWQKKVFQPSISFLPLNENFETFNACDTSANCDLEVCNLSNGWSNGVNGSDDDIDWRINAGKTPTNLATGNTGPSTDNTPGTATGQYAYLEATGCTGRQALMISPCINLISEKNAKLSFAYHMFGANMGDLHVDVLYNGQWTQDIMPALSGDKGNEWKSANVSLQAFTGKIINIAFRGVTGSGELSDMAIDAVSVKSTSGVGSEPGSLYADIYPNPSEGIFNVVLNSSESADILIADVNGRVIAQQQVKANAGIIPIDLQHASAGVYFVTIRSAGQSVNRKLVKL